MRKLFIISTIALTAAACTKSGGGTSTETQAPYTVTTDKTQIESDGKDAVTFTLTDANGLVLTDDAQLLSKIYFINEATGKRLPRKTTSFRSVEDGEYEFSATFQGEPCANKVKVKSSGRRKYELFRKNVALYRFTATWCENCPAMTLGLDRVSDWTKSRIVELDLHGNGSTYAYSDGSRYVADYLYPLFNAPGFPSCVYDLDIMSATRTFTEIEDIVFDRIADSPATCGIKASCIYSDGALTVSARVKSSTGGKYDIGFAVLKDNCVPGGNAHEEVYNDVVIAMTGNYYNMSSDSFTLAEGGESAEVSHTISLKLDGDQKDYSVVAYALKQNGNDVAIDNIVEVAFGKSVDYVYNPENK